MAKKGKPTKTARKKKNSSKFLAIAITVIIIGIAIYYFYSADQAKIRGFTFGNEIQALQHIEKFNNLLKKYDDLQPPDVFARSVKLFKLSLEYQIESHEHRVEWIKTGDELELVRFQELTQLAFEAEQAGLKAFNDAKAGIKQ